MAWLAPILVLGIVILVHEAGHFWAAKVFGVYAPRFGIGFGPALWRKRWGETEYVLGALPFGGYVRMATRDDEASTALEGELTESKGGDKEPQDPDAMIPFGPKPVPPDRWFESKPLWQRAIILLAGVTMNVALAVVVCTGLIETYQGTGPRPVVAQAGLTAGDSIVSVQGTPTRTWADMTAAVTTSVGEELRIGVIRDGKSVELHVTPVAATDTNPETGATRTVGRIGAYAKFARYPIGTALVKGTQKTWDLGTMVVGTVRGLVTGKVGVTELGGPIAIVRTSVVVARTGFENLLLLIAFLSVNLAVLNLIPIPLLDGGQLLMQTAETIRGRAFGDRTREWIARVGLGAIAALFITVTFNDLKSLVMAWLK
jgi:regulator of sigma E protease